MPTAKARRELLVEARDRRAKRAQLEHEFALQEREEQIARLRALRLAKKSDETERRREDTTADAVTAAEKDAR